MSTTPALRPSRAEVREATRERLLDAAEELFAERGFHAARLEDVASHAGYTIGAIYHNFRGKQELFLATFERMITRYIAAFERALEAGSDMDARRHNAAALLARSLAQDPRGFALYLEFCMYALRNPALLPRFAERFTLFRDSAAAWLEREAQASGGDLSMAATDYAILVNALTNGFGLAKLIHGAAVDDELFERGLAVMLAPVAASARQSREGG
jgi:AcrR family transcriptional regulator